jgi:coenzyme F420 hydrogenase subunit beta
LIEEMKPFFGPVLEVWEAYATDPQIRWLGSSGGVLTALSAYGLEQGGMYGVLHVAGDPADPIRNRTRLSRTRDELLEATGSRYAPASACDGLALVADAPAPCVFIGQPSEVTALRKAQMLRPVLSRKVGLTLSFLCAGSPSTRGTQELLRKSGIAEDQILELRYRGRGWPGSFALRAKDRADFVPVMSYANSWALVQQFRPFSVSLTPDGSGEDADIACGDPWYTVPAEGEAGRSIVIVRTERGRAFLHAACKAGYLRLTGIDASAILRSQANLVRKRRAIWGRLLALRLLGLPIPKLSGFSLFSIWFGLPLFAKARSVVGTFMRVVERRYYWPLDIASLTALPRERRAADEKTPDLWRR